MQQQVQVEQVQDTADQITQELHDFLKNEQAGINDWNVGASKAGYDQAWKDMSERLENMAEPLAEKSYFFEENNPYLEESYRGDSASALLEEAMKLFQQGKIKNAILAFQAVLQQESEVESPDEVWRMLGLCHTENDEDKKAIICLNKGLECDPYNLDILVALGTSFVNELDSIKALETLRSWVSHNPSFQGIEMKPDEYSDGSLMDEVTQLMLAVVEFAPNDVDALIILGVLYNVSLDYESAIDCFQKALQTRPNDYTLLNKVS